MNKASNYKRIFTAIAFFLVTVLLITGGTYAWFAYFNPEINAENVGGQLLTNYFHCGNGTEEDPFVITRPVHYYNLVNLYQRVINYSDEKFYFQLGYELKGDGNGFYVYDYDDNGNAKGENIYSDTLNLECYNTTATALLPIGTHDKNFKGTFEGNGLSIANFTVSTLADTKDCDIGIFGYVASCAAIQNVYFDNVTIDLSNVSHDTSVISAQTEGQTHNPAVHTVNDYDLAYVGYIAGHIISNAQCNDVYVNNIKIVGGGANTEASSNFSYFGCVETPEGELANALSAAMVDLVSDGIGIDEMYERASEYYHSPEAADEYYTSSETYWTHGSTTELINSSSTSDVKSIDTASSQGSFAFKNVTSDTVNLVGKSEAIQTVTNITVGTANNGFYLTSSNGSISLCLNDEKNGVVTKEGISQPTVWTSDAAGHIYTVVINDDAHCEDYYYLHAANITTDPSEPKYEAGITSDSSIATTWTWETYGDGNTKLTCHPNSADPTDIWNLVFPGEILSDAEGSEGGGSTKAIIQSVYNNVTYYLKSDNEGNLSATTNEEEATEFLQDGEFWYADISGTNKYLTYESSTVKLKGTGNGMTAHYINNTWIIGIDQEVYWNGSTWKTQSVRNIPEYYLYRNQSNNNNFLSVSNGAIYNAIQSGGTTTNVTVPSNTCTWTLPNGSNDYITTTIGGVTYYLVGTITDLSLSITTNTESASKWIIEGYNYIRMVSSSSNKYYIGFDGSTWVLVTRSSTSIRRTFPINAGSDPADNEASLELTKKNGIMSHSAIDKPYEIVNPPSPSSTPVPYPTTDTWFPIVVTEGGVVDESNMGYVVGGMNNDKHATVQLKISSASSIGSSYTYDNENPENSTFTAIKTVSGDGVVNADAADFSIYQGSKKRFLEYLTAKTDKENIYSMHFMNSVVSENDFTTACSVMILGNEYTDYQLPRHCLDVYLEKDGYISLFAGKYDSSNTGFFSIYHIVRDDTQCITGVHKISQIYRDAMQNLHYIDSREGYTPSAGDELVFDAAWMSQSISGEAANQLFYFEIPVEAGEYAISAEDGNNGAQLLYLNAAEAELGLAKGSTPALNFNVDYRSAGYIGSEKYVGHSLLQFAIDAPGASPEDFSVEVTYASYTEPNTSKYLAVPNTLSNDIPAAELLTDAPPTGGVPYVEIYGIYNIKVINKTENPIGLTVYILDDDDDLENNYNYAYCVQYSNNGTAYDYVTHQGKQYLQTCAELKIPSA